jgi:hypothetical protein
VRGYLAALQPWEDEDLYVFDASVTWCIALTHPQMGNERLLIVAGTFPPCSGGSGSLPAIKSDSSS